MNIFEQWFLVHKFHLNAISIRKQNNSVQSMYQIQNLVLNPAQPCDHLAKEC